MASYTTYTAIVLCIVPSVLAGGCPRDWVQFQDYCLTLVDEVTTWITAQENCRAFSAHLAALQTKEKDLNLVKFLKMKQFKGDLWIDGNDMLAIGDWNWAHTGEILTYTKWESAEPDNLLTSRCMAVKDGDVDWRSRPCHERHQFVCEKNIATTDGTLIG